jgi:hypothetical protein
LKKEADPPTLGRPDHYVCIDSSAEIERPILKNLYAYMNIQPLSILLAGLPAEHKVNLFGSYREAFGQLSDEEVKALIQISKWRSYGENDKKSMTPK